MGNIIPVNSFLQGGDPVPNNCLDNIPLCLPLKSLADVNFQLIQTVSGITPPTYTLKLIASCGTFTLGVSWLKNPIGSTQESFTRCELVLGSIVPDLHILAAKLNTEFALYGVWSFDGTNIVSTADLSSFDLVIPGLTYHLSLPHTMIVGTYGESPGDIVDYMNLTYSSFGTWSLDPSGNMVCTGNICEFEGTIPGASYTISGPNHDILTTTFVSYLNPASLGIALPGCLKPGDCFHFRITDTGTGEIINSNCFIYTPNICFTTRIRYTNNENAFGFTYLDLGGTLIGFYNTIRLPMFLTDPQTKTTRSVYRTSDGSYVKLSAIMSKEFKVNVDWISDDWHTKLAIALEHDTFEIWDEVASAWVPYIFQNGDYAREWHTEPGINLNVCPASFTLNAEPFHNINSNCK